MLTYRGDKFIKGKKFTINESVYRFQKRDNKDNLIFEGANGDKITLTEEEFDDKVTVEEVEDNNTTVIGESVDTSFTFINGEGEETKFTKDQVLNCLRSLQSSVENDIGSNYYEILDSIISFIENNRFISY